MKHLGCGTTWIATDWPHPHLLFSAGCVDAKLVRLFAGTIQTIKQDKKRVWLVVIAGMSVPASCCRLGAPAASYALPTACAVMCVRWGMLHLRAQSRRFGVFCRRVMLAWRFGTLTCCYYRARCRALYVGARVACSVNGRGQRQHMASQSRAVCTCSPNWLMCSCMYGRHVGAFVESIWVELRSRAGRL